MKYINSLIICIIISIGIMQAQNYMCTEYSGGIVSLSGDSATIKLCAEDYNPYTVGNDPHTMSVNLPSGRRYSITGRVELEQVQYLDYITLREEDAAGNTVSTLASYLGCTIDNIHLITKSTTGRIRVDIFCAYGATSATSGFDFTIAPATVDTIEVGHVLGALGIGTSTPQKELHVVGDVRISSNNGKWMQLSSSSRYPLFSTNADRFDFNKPIRSESVKTGAIFVDSVYGADFVFDNNYQLRSLQDVYSFVKEHGHLPEIQSAVDMQQNGINMSEFQIQLLQKIEELTLYIIQQDNRIKELEKYISQ